MRGFFKKYKTSLTMMIPTIVLGFLVGVQFRNGYIANQLLLQKQNQVELYEAMLTKEKKTFDNLSKKHEKALVRNEKLLQNNMSEKKTKELNERLNEVKFLAGIADVTGNGVIITLDDADKEEISGEEGLSDYIIHYRDVLCVLNVLKAHGAQAISINDERILNSSSQICSGSTISINKNKYVLPYTIKAIGDQQRMYRGFLESEIYSELTFFKMTADIQMADNIFIKAGLLD